MTRLLFYASPVDHHNPAAWYRYRDRTRDILTGANAAGSVSVDDDPLFTYGTEVASVIARVNATRPRPGEIVLAQWSTIVFYSASVLFLGDGVDARAVRTALSGEPFLKEHVGDYSLESASCYAYQLAPYEDEEKRAVRRLVECVPDRVYAAPLDLLYDEEGAVVDEERFEVLRQRQPTRPGFLDGRAVFKPRSAELEEEIWDLGARLEGLAVLSENDPRTSVLLEATDFANELPLFTGEEARPLVPRVTIQRCHMDDAIVCLYNHAYVEGATLQFLV